MQEGRPQLPRYLFCLSNWFIMLNIRTFTPASCQSRTTCLQSKQPVEQTIVLFAIFDELEPSIQPVHAVEDFRIHMPTVSSVRFLSLIVVHYQSADRQLLTYMGTAVLQSFMPKVAQPRSSALHCACSTLPNEWSHHFLPPSHHCLSDPLDLSHSVLDHARTRSNGQFLHPQISNDRLRC